MMVSATKRTKYITIQQQAGRDGYGAETDTWSDIKSLWAGVEPLSGKEYFTAKGLQADVTHRMRMRYFPGVTPKMRVLLGSRVFNILSAMNIEERGRELELMCQEVVDA